MTSEEQCYFLVNGLDCTNRREDPYPFCSQHRTTFGTLDNPTLIEQAAQAFAQTLYVRTDKKLTATTDRNLLDAFINRLHELQGRAYSQEDALDAIAAVAQEKGMYDRLFKQMGKDPKWKRFEKIVAGIHKLQAQGAKVKFNDKIKSKKTGRPRQIDVSIRFKQGFYDYLTIVECKDSHRRVAETQIEAFSKKMEAVGARHGVLVARKGFQKGAIGSAKFENIDLYTLTEIKSDWTKKINANIVTVPFPTEIEFDYPYFDASPLVKGPLSINYGDIRFYRDQKSPPVPLTDLLRNIAKWVVKQQLALPCRVKAPFTPPALYQFPGTDFYTPIYAMYVRMEPYRLGVGYEIDVPPKLQKYVYSDVANQKTFEFPPGDLPKVD
jgi:hypothetical protein